MGGDIVSETIDGAREAAIRREALEGALAVLLRNTFCFMNEVECPGHSPENCEACARKVLGVE